MATLPEDFRDQLIDHMPEAVIAADCSGVITFWNPGAERMFGYASREALGQSLDIIIPERFRGRHWDGYRNVMATGVTRYESERLLAVPAVRKDGQRISIEFSLVLLRDATGTVSGTAAIVRDVTARWERERAGRERGG